MTIITSFKETLYKKDQSERQREFVEDCLKEYRLEMVVLKGILTNLYSNFSSSDIFESELGKYETRFEHLVYCENYHGIFWDDLYNDESLISEFYRYIMGALGKNLVKPEGLTKMSNIIFKTTWYNPLLCSKFLFKTLVDVSNNLTFPIGLFGSFVSGKPDEFSDVDIILYDQGSPEGGSLLVEHLQVLLTRILGRPVNISLVKFTKPEVLSNAHKNLIIFGPNKSNLLRNRDMVYRQYR